MFNCELFHWRIHYLVAAPCRPVRLRVNRKYFVPFAQQFLERRHGGLRRSHENDLHKTKSAKQTLRRTETFILISAINNRNGNYSSPKCSSICSQTFCTHENSVPRKLVW